MTVLSTGEDLLLYLNVPCRLKKQNSLVYYVSLNSALFVCLNVGMFICKNLFLSVASQRVAQNLWPKISFCLGIVCFI